MGLWDKVSKFASAAGEVLQEAAEKERARREEHMDRVYREQDRLKNLSKEELLDLAGSGSGTRQTAAKLELRKRGSDQKQSLASTRPKRRTAHYNPGRQDIRVAFILSCPGSAEDAVQRPASGQTGENLERRIARWHVQRPDLFISTERYDYVITNAHSRVEFKKKTGRSEASDAEVLDDKNIKRIAREVAGCEVVICLGKKASLVKSRLQEAGFNGTVACGIHPGWQAINRKYPQLEKDARHAAAADDVLDQL